MNASGKCKAEWIKEMLQKNFDQSMVITDFQAQGKWTFIPKFEGGKSRLLIKSNLSKDYFPGYYIPSGSLMDGKVSDRDKNVVCYVYKCKKKLFKSTFGWDLLVCEIFAFKVDNFRPKIGRHLQDGVTSLFMNIFELN